MSIENSAFQPMPIGSGVERSRASGEDRTALLCIDLQYLNCVDHLGVFSDHRQSGVSEQAIHYYLNRVHNTVVPNVKSLQQLFREQGNEVIHIRIRSLTADGRDRSPEHKRLGIHAAPGSNVSRFLEEVKPKGDEIVIDKTASGVFVATNLEYVLRNLCVKKIYVVGVFTNECVSSAVRSASDLGFDVTVIADATAAITSELHEATLLTTEGRYAQVETTQTVRHRCLG